MIEPHIPNFPDNDNDPVPFNKVQFLNSTLCGHQFYSRDFTYGQMEELLKNQSSLLD